jgi:hypothetical protein
MEAEHATGVKVAKVDRDCLPKLGGGWEQVSFFPADGTRAARDVYFAVEDGSSGKKESGGRA